VASVAYRATVKVGGVPVPIHSGHGEPLAYVSGSGATQLWQVVNAARRIWDPKDPIVLFDNDTLIDPASYPWTFNYLSGQVQFIGYTPSGGGTGISIHGSYIPVLAILECKKFDFQCMVDLLDKSNFDTGQARSKLAALLDFQGSVEFLSQINDDLDSGTGGLQSLESYLVAGTPLMLEVGLDGGTNFFRVWMQQDSEQVQASCEGLIENSLSWKGSAQGAGASFYLGT
jgi:hypothetical protein